ncbi:TIGR01777 family oxidoreductase [Corynebacterium sputi]|uniref:TIGR01777 family oxidoreductase n=1 Tax=Corynebacterium sputi TaxID=489915 RepID=UPI00040AE035|nr:TIGR01777 family oxidoreductase [Corynebacterium sputi]
MRLVNEESIPYDQARVWAWYESPGAIRRLMPGLLPMRPTSEATALPDGHTSLTLPLGISLSARHQPADFIEGRQFADSFSDQPLQGLLKFTHVHEILPNGDNTLIRDTVSSRFPIPTMRQTLHYRNAVTAGDLAAADRLAGYVGVEDADAVPRKTIAISGSTGLIGTQLTALLSMFGHRVIRLVRDIEAVGTHDDDCATESRFWEPADPDGALLQDVDTLIHLAGASIMGRFTDSHLAKIRSTRVCPTKKLAKLASMSGVSTIVCASAVGYYGADRGDEVLPESASTGEGPLADIVSDWEEALEPAREAGVRVVNVRTGLVLAGGGGLLPVLAAPIAGFLGGPIGKETRWFPWIALDDMLDIYHRAALDPALSGPVNAVSPGLVDDKEFTDILGSVLRRPTAITVPSFAPSVILGREGNKELALSNQRVIPEALESANHAFRFTSAEQAIRHELLRRN